MRQDLSANLATNRDYDPAPAKVLPKLPIYDELLRLAVLYDEFKRQGKPYSAQSIKAQAQREVDRWLDNQDARALADAEALELVAEARAHVSETLAQWKRE